MPAVAPTELDPLDVLAQASASLASSLDLSVSLPLVAELCVAQLADYCAIYAGQGPALIFAEASAESSYRLRAHMGSLPDALRDRGLAQVLVLPLTAREQQLGSLILAHGGSETFDARIEKIAKILALQIASALDQAVLFERTHRVADRLQRALLPASLPAIPGTAFHASYRPASEESEVGGDWYDAFALGDGRVAISMGDVAGHGLEAAAVMGELRQAMRSAAVNERSPAAVLEHVNSVVNLREGIGMVTAIFGYYYPQTRELVYAVAGHPPPALAIESGFSGLLPGGGLPLGIQPQIGCVDWTITLAPRSCTVFYTDGMTEYARDVIQGEAHLVEACAAVCSGAPGADPAVALDERIFAARSNRDDAASLVLTCSEQPVGSVARFSAVPVIAPIARSILNRFCEEHGIEATQRFSILTAAGEAIANAVEHAYAGHAPGSIAMRMRFENGTVTIEVEDYGHWQPFQRREERGRGLMLMHELMDRVRITSEQNRTVITLISNQPD